MDKRWSLHPIAVSYGRPDSPQAFVLPFALCSLFALVMLPFGPTIRGWELASALALQLLVGFAVALAPRYGFDRVRHSGSVAIVAYLVSVAVIRDAVGPTAGYGPLALLPVIWASLRGRRDELAVAVIGLAIVYVVPAVVIGPPRYTAGSWRGGVMFSVLAATVGITVVQLVRHVGALVGQLAEQARTDELTGLPNRRGWQELLSRELSLAARTDRAVAVALLDLDFFKEYNDTNGHLAGDRLLLAITAAWHGVLREVDVLARWGGDEFALLLPGCTAPQAIAVLERLRLAVPDLEFSAGIAQWGPGSSSESLLTSADRALYRAKHAERNSSVIA